jgi:tetratricopeptide (TPR) repeat protein
MTRSADLDRADVEISAGRFNEAKTILLDVLNEPNLPDSEKELANKKLSETKLKDAISYLKSVSLDQSKLQGAFEMVAYELNDMYKTYDSTYYDAAIQWYISALIEMAQKGVDEFQYDYALIYAEEALRLSPDNHDAAAIKMAINEQAREVQEALLKQQTENNAKIAVTQSMRDYLQYFRQMISLAGDASNEPNSSAVLSLKTQLMIQQLPTNDFLTLQSYGLTLLDDYYAIAKASEKRQTSKDTKNINKEFEANIERIKLSGVHGAKVFSEMDRLTKLYQL